MSNRRHTTTAQLEARIAELEARNALYQRSPAFGCYTRQALDIDILPDFDARGFALVYFDVDDLTTLNSIYGKAERKDPLVPCVNERIFVSFAALRSGDLIIGQWYSGDEFIALVPAEDALGFACRLTDVLQSNGITATFTITAIDRPLRQAIDHADNLTSEAKKAGLRNRIHDHRSAYNER